MPQLLAAAEAGRVRLHTFSSADGERLTADRFVEAMDRSGATDLSNHHLAMCGPPGLLRAVADAARTRGALHAHAHAEDFDIRQGFGPDVDLRALWADLSGTVHEGEHATA